MSSRNRREYLTALVLDQAFLDRCQDNLENGLSMIADIEAPDSTIIKASDRNKYVDGVFYEALTRFPAIKRSLGEWLQAQIEFSTLTLSLSNVDGRYNGYLPGGALFSTWISKQISVSIGLRDVGATYTPFYQGNITDVSGVSRDRKDITLTARDLFDRVNTKFPTQVFNVTNYPTIEDNFVGKAIPVIYGDWTVYLPSVKLIPTEPTSATVAVPIVPATPLNGLDANVQLGTTNIALQISINANEYFDSASVYLKRGDEYHLIDSGDIANISVDNNYFEIIQGNSGGTTLVNAELYTFSQGDAFLVAVKGKDLGVGYNDNIGWQAKDILKTYGNLVDADFDANWDIYCLKNTPAQSNIAGFKSRVWVQDVQETMGYVLSMLEQVRLEAFVSRELKLKVNSLHFEDMEPNPEFTLRNWDIEADSFNPVMDDNLTWNRAKGAYGFNPSRNENAYETSIYKNLAAIAQAGKEISKLVVFPNLYIADDVVKQLQEMLRLTSNYNEMITTTVTARAFLRELGEFVNLNVSMGSLVYANTPAMIRDIVYNPEGLKIGLKLWSFQMIPYPGYSPIYPGITGGDGATITEET